MKLREVAPDEFRNTIMRHRGNIDHLYKAQCARAYSFVETKARLAKKYPEWELGQNPHEFFHTKSRRVSSFPNVGQFDSNCNGGGLTDAKDRKILVDKYARMLNAKKKFEQAGGNYGDYLGFTKEAE